ncbi:MAG TPA: 30S ribosomal protein S2 [Aestuariivirgaceae bacterium]|nr:30S ribosomal protein S2 [Aestuariivirgaceae bacterium]
MALPDFSMRQLLEAGVHFGHQTHRWNPKMKNFIYGSRNGIHIIDLAQTVPLLHQALVAIRDSVAAGGRVLFVGTKRQASESIVDAAKRSAQYYINSRWLGGTLTNWKTISNSIKRLRQLEEILSKEDVGLTKRELLNLTREKEKLESALGGIKDMGGTPDIMFVIDTNKEQLAIKEANRLNIPVVAVLDSNSSPAGVTYPIPGNDDAGRAISLYCDLMARAAIEGISQSQAQAGFDLGAAENPVVEAVPPAEEAGEALGDISRVRGITLTLKKKLDAEGVNSIKQIAEWAPEKIAELDEKLKLRGRIGREEWVEQARDLVAGNPPRERAQKAQA